MKSPFNEAQQRFLMVMRISVAVKAAGIVGLVVTLRYLGVLG